MNLPNKLTVLRILLAGVFVALLSFDGLIPLVAGLIVFTIASITDYYDGMIARRDNLITNFGKLLDPVADKILVSAAFIMLMGLPELHIPSWTVVVMLAREFMVTGARSLAATGGHVIGANKWGKGKTILQMVFIYLFLVAAILCHVFSKFHVSFAGAFSAWVRILSLWASIAVALFTVITGIQFGWINRKILDLGDTE